MNGFPDTGKIIVMAPEQAALVAEQVTSEQAKRIFTADGIAPDKAYVIDMDRFYAETTITRSFEEIRNRLWEIGT